MGPASLQIELKSVRRPCDVDEAGLKLFFSEPILGPPKVNLRHRNGKMNVKKVHRARTETSNCAKLGSGTKPRQKSESDRHWNPN